MGCGRNWKDNNNKSPNKRGTPGIFTKVKALKSWIQQTMNNELKGHSRSILPEAVNCSVTDGALIAVEGRLDYPESPRLYYENNEICLWTIYVPEGKHILLEFIQFDIEPGIFCGNDSLSVYDEQDKLIGSGCGSQEILSKQGVIQSMQFPQQYSSNAQCQWLIQAPENHMIKLEFEDFEVELSNNCSNDLVKVHDTWTESNQSVKLCGLSPPPPVFCNSTAMMVQFNSDGIQELKGFRATVSFIDVPVLYDKGQLNDSELERIVNVFSQYHSPKTPTY
ncbi:ovochymase-2 [Cetorhinus maximus]